MNRISVRLLLAALLALGALSACDSDDGGSGPTGDTTAPAVVSIDPDQDDTNVPVGEDITVVFSEAMDPATGVTGNVTLSSGTVSEVTWINDRTLEISHSNWTEGTEITVTLGTGFTDAAGNALATAFTASFFTVTSEVTLLASNPEDGATGVTRNTTVQMLFSRRMNLASLSAATSVNSVLMKAPIPFSLDSGNDELLLAI